MAAVWYACVSAELLLFIGVQVVLALWVAKRNGAGFRLVPDLSEVASANTRFRSLQIVLLLLRVAYFIFATYHLVAAIVHFGIGVMAAFTYWNYTLQVVWFGLSSALTFSATLPGGIQVPAPIRCVVLLSAEICLPFSIGVSIVYWSVLAPAAAAAGDPDAYAMNAFVVHLINTITIIIDFSINRIQIRYQHIWIVGIWGTAFLLFAWAYHAITGNWVYFFLEMDDYKCLFWEGGVMVLFTVMYLLSAALTSCKPITAVAPSHTTNNGSRHPSAANETELAAQCNSHGVAKHASQSQISKSLGLSVC